MHTILCINRTKKSIQVIVYKQVQNWLVIQYEASIRTVHITTEKSSINYATENAVLLHVPEHIAKNYWLTLKCSVRYISLHLLDQITSWPIATTIPDKEATTVANAIHKDLILQHGAPEILLSGNGKEFCNDTLAYVCQEYGLAQHFTSRSNYKAENFNKFLKASIRKLCQADNAAWIKYLIRSYLHIGVVLTPPLVKHHIHCSTLERSTHTYSKVDPTYGII